MLAVCLFSMAISSRQISTVSKISINGWCILWSSVRVLYGQRSTANPRTRLLHVSHVDLIEDSRWLFGELVYRHIHLSVENAAVRSCIHTAHAVEPLWDWDTTRRPRVLQSAGRSMFFRYEVAVPLRQQRHLAGSRRGWLAEVDSTRRGPVAEPCQDLPRVSGILPPDHR
jgi:hypothetical protein